MAQYKSNNEYYRSADIARPVENIKKILGLSGTADSDYLTGLGKVSRLEGTEMDNRKKQGLWKALTDATGVEGLTLDQILMRHLGKDASDFQGAITGEKEQPFRVDIQRQKARQEQQGVEQGDLLAKLAKSIANMGGGTEDPRPEGYEREAFPWQGGQGDPMLSDEALVGAMQRFAALSNKPHTITTDPLGKQGAKITSGKVSLLQARTTAAKNLGVANVALANKRTAEVLARMGLAGKLNAEKIKEIQDRVLINWNQGFQKATTAKKRRELLEQEIKTEIQRTLGAKETVKKKVAETSIAQKEEIATEDKLSNAKKQYEQKLKILEEKLAKEKDLGKKAKINADIAKLTKDFKVKVEENKKLKSQVDLDTSTVKLDNLKASHTEKIATLKKQLEKATGDAEIAVVKSRIAAATEQFKIDKARLEAENAELTGRKISSDIRKNLTNMSSPSDLDLTRLLKKARILNAQGDDMGDGTIPDSDAEVPPEVASGGGLSTDNIGPNWEKFKAWLSGSTGGGTVAGQGQPKGNPMEIELAKLSQQPVAKWTPDQRNRYIQHAVQNLGLDPKAAASLLQRAIQAQGPSIRR